MRIDEVFKITEKHMAYFVVDMMYNQKKHRNASDIGKMYTLCMGMQIRISLLPSIQCHVARHI